MRYLNRSFLLKYSPLLISLSLLLVIVLTQPLFLNEKTTKPASTSKVEETNNQDSSQVKEDVKEENVQGANNSVDINVNNSTSTNANNSSSTGTCKVTKNGETTLVPADQVKIIEKYSGDLDLKVECEKKINSTQNSTSVKNDIKINTSTSN